MAETDLIDKLSLLSPHHVEEVEDFIDFLLERKSPDSVGAMKLSEEALAEVWANPEDSVYDAL